jgi:hypothetical protein
MYVNCTAILHLLLAFTSTCTAAVPTMPTVTVGRSSSTPPPARHGMVRYEIFGVCESKLDGGSQHAQRFLLDCTCFRDGDRIDVQTTRRDDGRPVRAWRSIVNGWYVSYEVPPAGERSPFGYYAADGRSFAGAAVPSALAVFVGYAADDFTPLSDLLKTVPRIQTSQETVEGVSCLHVRADSPDFGDYQLWLDLAARGLPRKMVVQKSAANYWGRQRLNEWTHLAPRGSRGSPSLQAVRYTLDQVQLDQVKGHWFPLAGRVTRVQTYSDGNVERTVMTCRRTAIDLEPDFAKARAFVPQLREGARLANQAQPHLPFEWKEGKPVPLVDRGLVAQMNRTAQSLRQQSEELEGAAVK